MLELAIIYLAAAIIVVPLAKRLGLGSVLGYLFAGMLIGPYALGMVGDQTDVMHFAEFGVVMMLFLVGLELQPSILWRLRKSILGLGGLQVVLTSIVFFAIGYLVFEMKWQTSLAIALMLSLSSTAIVLQTLTEKGWIKQEAGQNAFSVLLFQDIAVIPILALLPLLAFLPAQESQEHSASIIAHLPVLEQVGISIAAIVFIILAGRYISAPIFRYIAETRLREMFTVFALFLVIAIALLMQKVGLSPALGTFLAGVVLAESEFRHELEVDIEPFKGLLLGLFFVTVGASIDFELLSQAFVTVVLLVVLLILVKVAVLYVLAFLFKMNKSNQLLFALALAQGGEFAFVLLGLTSSLQILSVEQTKLTTLVVAVSMLFTPVILMVYEKIINKKQTGPAFDDKEEIETSKSVIIAGYGRFGQMIGRLLKAQGYQVTILDHSASQIDLLRKFGHKVFYGDAARKDLLDAAGANEAKLLVIAIDDSEKSLEIVEFAQRHYPNLKLVVRAVNRGHAYKLINMKVDAFNRETFDSAITLAVDSLKLLGNSTEDAERAGEVFRKHDLESLYQLSDMSEDDENYGIAVRQRTEELSYVLSQDKEAEAKKAKTQ
ncbi:monovalent cation:proton antiporter-2 (CPA2) family protein [Pseudocolwellia sp. AS88]|uniref:monovalent cation:proton antiporter-2 (CPA2) family protein n=1 Tax=Pseudocolwellia sp. AS88 TaxID=3063958 RepID=UPI0026E92E0D|nr:monovalent cation:proton antiporter-2 (CPA2) family protein [Pseudocolwellia sp. AS88]MDO7083991.1 monovalent cation:proton antiporter-2 (CPA2) family protein [Pseudocolwellia sp. AS88]